MQKRMFGAGPGASSVGEEATPQANAPSRAGKTGTAVLNALKQDPVLLVAHALLAGLLAYTALRAAYIPITHDEAFTVIEHVPNSYAIILGLKIAPVVEFANNHPLNTSAIKLLSGFLGLSEIIVRLPNLLAGFLFAVIMLVHVIRLRLKAINLVVAYAFCLTSPLLLEFFALARGYGLAVSLFLAGYTLWLYADNDSGRRFFRTIAASGVCFALALTANLSIAFAVVGVTIAEILFRLLPSLRRQPADAETPKIRGFMRIVRAYTLSALPFLVITYAVYGKTLPIARKVGAFYIQDRRGVLTGTLPGIARDWTTALSPEAQQIAVLLFIVALIPAVLLSLRLFLKTRLQDPRNRPALLILGSVPFIYFAPTLLDLFFHTGFPFERTALYYLPLFSLLVTALLANLQDIRSVVVRTYSFLLVVGMVVAVSLAFTALNLKSTTYWKYDATEREQYQLLTRLIQADPHLKSSHSVAAGADWILSPAMNFYRQRDANPHILPMQRRTPLDAEFCFVFLVDGFDGRLRDRSFYLPGWQEVQYWPLSEVRLIQNKGCKAGAPRTNPIEDRLP